MSVNRAENVAADLRVFGRRAELEMIDNSLVDAASSGILIEGEIGVGKSCLARSIFLRRGSGDIWIRGDRVLQWIDFGALGLIVDLDGDPETLLSRIVATLTSSRSPRVVFADDAHLLDERTREVLSELADDGVIRLVALTRTTAKDERIPFSELVEDRIVGHLVLGVLRPEDYREMVEASLGGIASQGVIDIVSHHSGRNPGKLLELLEYTSRKNRFLHRRGVWLLDGLDIDYDERARDYTRIELSQYSAQEREALALVVLAGEVDLETMLEAELGAAADALVVTGELRIEHGSSRTYVAAENSAFDTIRYTTPVGRSRAKFEFIAGSGDSPSDWAKVLRTEWGLLCGAEVNEREVIDSARTAAHLGDWLRAMRLLAEVPTDRMEAHELFDLARLYCGCNKVPIGLDILAQCVKKACCAQLVIDALVIWMNRDFGRTSPALSADDFRRSFERLRTQANAHSSPGLSVQFGLRLLDQVGDSLRESRPVDRRVIGDLSGQRALPTTVRLLDTILNATAMLDAGRTLEALALLEGVNEEYPTESSGIMNLRMLRVRALLQLNRVEEAKRALRVLPTHDIAYLAARSGPVDLLWAQAHLLEGELPKAMHALRASIEALEYWNQTGQLAIALAEAEYATVRAGMPEEADELHARFDELPAAGLYHERRRALVLRTVARWLRTADRKYERELRNLLRSAQEDGAAAIQALIRLCLFRHFDESEPEEMVRVGRLGTGREFELLRVLGAALMDKDGAALIRFAEVHERSMPDLGARCRRLASRFFDAGAGSGSSGGLQAVLTVRERQISRLIVDGRSNSEIAGELGVRVRTVEGHTYRLFRKLGITRREQVADALRTVRAS